MRRHVRERRRVLVVFERHHGRTFWLPFCRPGFGHCYVIAPMYFPEPGLFATRYSFKLELLRGFLHMAEVWRSPDELAQEAYRHGATAVVALDIDVSTLRGYTPRGLLTCVSLVKAVIDCRNWRIITPWQLFRVVIRRGGKLIAERKADDGTGILETEIEGAGPGVDRGAEETGGAARQEGSGAGARAVGP